MKPLAPARFSHAGFHVFDLATMSSFYCDTFGFTITDHGKMLRDDGVEIELLFLSSDPKEHHEIVMVSGRPKVLAFNPINQFSFRVPDLDALRDYYHHLGKDERASELRPVSHGNAISLYFRDPEGNRLELYFDTPWYVTQPMREAVDLNLPSDVLMQQEEQRARQKPGFEPMQEWQKRMQRRMSQRDTQ